MRGWRLVRPGPLELLLPLAAGGWAWWFFYGSLRAGLLVGVLALVWGLVGRVSEEVSE